MMWLKGCPKCQGDLFEEPAIGRHTVSSRYISCLQCGHVLGEHEEALLQTAKKPKEGGTRVVA